MPGAGGLYHHRPAMVPAREGVALVVAALEGPPLLEVAQVAALEGPPLLGVAQVAELEGRPPLEVVV